MGLVAVPDHRFGDRHQAVVRLAPERPRNPAPTHGARNQGVGYRRGWNPGERRWGREQVAATPGKDPKWEPAFGADCEPGRLVRGAEHDQTVHVEPRGVTQRVAQQEPAQRVPDQRDGIPLPGHGPELARKPLPDLVIVLGEGVVPEGAGDMPGAPERARQPLTAHWRAAEAVHQENAHYSVAIRTRP